MSVSLFTPVEKIKGIGPSYGRILARRGIACAGDLLLLFPESYIDFSRVTEQPVADEERLYPVALDSVHLGRNFKKRISLLTVKGKIATLPVRLVFFNQPYLLPTLARKKRIYAYGRIETRAGVWQMVNPQLAPENRLGQVVPRYRPLATLKGGNLRKLIAWVLAEWREERETLPQTILRRHDFPGLAHALRTIHQPRASDLSAVEKMKARFIYSEFLAFQLELQFIRAFFRGRRRLHRYRFSNDIRLAIDRRLPFTLSAEQVSAFSEIVNDLGAPHTMQRLLQGEVGSGKTIVAFLALLLARENGYQGAFLAPTELLAGQHFRNAQAFFAVDDIALLTGDCPAGQKKEIQKRLRSGEISLVFGTHALINEAIAFRNLSMVVIDEQHRFGVAQRAALFFKSRSADLLVTTATPIPRTMRLALYNDVAVSTLKKPLAGRRPVITRVIAAAGRQEFYRQLRRELDRGGRGYVIMPLIDKSEGVPELRSLQEETAVFKELWPDIPLAAISGKTKPEQKERILRQFRQGRIRLLLATTVVEVGIDVPEATFMVIENADRYGLSQLHQLRGRVGRGTEQSYCYLLASSQPTENGKLRLQAIAATDDGFRIAELDMRLRGGGVIAGLEQAGELDFKLGDIKKDYPLFKAAQNDARLLLQNPAWQNDEVRNSLSALGAKIKSLSFS
ncbi:MAG: ATP-dependent DNA helicase RecG [Candidatus Aminicenantes bacterium]|nr:ATP-dependent DNA helicase RecG [Candidatus Aminicenantes bacterium]